MKKLLAVMVLLLAGCASVNQGQVSPRKLENALDSQEKWLRGLERGQPIQETTVVVVPGTQYSLETFQHGKIYQYISGRYPKTGTPYGLYFEAGRLEGLLLGEDVEDFYDWEYGHRTENDQWLQSGMAQTTEWVETRDLLGHDFDARVTHHRNETGAGDKTATVDAPAAEHNVGSTGGNSAEIIATMFFLGPVILAVAPIYFLSRGAETSDDNPSIKEGYRTQTYRESQRAASHRAQSNVGKLRPGTTTSANMLNLMGPPEFKLSWVAGKIWAYSYSNESPDMYIGTADGIVMWKEISGVEFQANK